MGGGGSLIVSDCSPLENSQLSSSSSSSSLLLSLFRMVDSKFVCLLLLCVFFVCVCLCV